jgi:hypothetical protein
MGHPYPLDEACQDFVFELDIDERRKLRECKFIQTYRLHIFVCAVSDESDLDPNPGVKRGLQHCECLREACDLLICPLLIERTS